MAQSTFIGRSMDGGKFSLGSEYNAARFRDFLKKNPGMRLKIEPLTPESDKQRRFFEGAIIPFFTYYQEGLDYRNPDDLETVREWLKIEFNGHFVTIKGKSHKVAQSTKGALNSGFLDRVMDWMVDQGYQVDLLNPNDYKHWRDAIRPHGGPENYIDYLKELRKLA